MPKEHFFSEGPFRIKLLNDEEGTTYSLGVNYVDEDSFETKSVINPGFLNNLFYAITRGFDNPFPLNFLAQFFNLQLQDDLFLVDLPVDNDDWQVFPDSVSPIYELIKLLCQDGKRENGFNYLRLNPEAKDEVRDLDFFERNIQSSDKSLEGKTTVLFGLSFSQKNKDAIEVCKKRLLDQGATKVFCVCLFSEAFSSFALRDLTGFEFENLKNLFLSRSETLSEAQKKLLFKLQNIDDDEEYATVHFSSQEVALMQSFLMENNQLELKGKLFVLPNEAEFLKFSIYLNQAYRELFSMLYQNAIYLYDNTYDMWWDRGTSDIAGQENAEFFGVDVSNPTCKMVLSTLKNDDVDTLYGPITYLKFEQSHPMFKNNKYSELFTETLSTVMLEAFDGRHFKRTKKLHFKPFKRAIGYCDLLDILLSKLEDNKRLLLGENQFTFSAALIQKHGGSANLLPLTMIATEYQQLKELKDRADQYRAWALELRLEQLQNSGADIRFGVDARRLQDIENPVGHFTHIHFNFPHDGSNFRARTLPKLIADFFQSAAAVQRPGDKVYMALPHHDKKDKNDFRLSYIYKLREAYAKAGYLFIKKRVFSAERYPGYQHAMTKKSGGAAVAENGREYIFERTSLSYEQIIKSEDTGEVYKSFYGEKCLILPEMKTEADTASYQGELSIFDPYEGSEGEEEPEFREESTSESTSRKRQRVAGPVSPQSSTPYRDHAAQTSSPGVVHSDKPTPDTIDH